MAKTKLSKDKKSLNKIKKAKKDVGEKLNKSLKRLEKDIPASIYHQVIKNKVLKTNVESIAKPKDSDNIKPKLSEEEKQERNEKTIFIGNLPPNTKKQQLKNLLSLHGTMLSCRFRKPNGKKILNKTKSDNILSIIAYAIMDSAENAEKCLVLNGTKFKNQHLRVTKLGDNIKTELKAKKTIFVGNLKYSATEEKLHNIFSTCGKIDYVRTINNDNGCIGCAYVCFDDKESVGLALELDKTLLDDRPIHVEKYSNNKPKSQKQPRLLGGAEKRMYKKMSKEKRVNSVKTFFKEKNLSAKETNKKINKGIKKVSGKKSDYRGKKAANKKPNKKMAKRNQFKELAKKIAPLDS